MVGAYSETLFIVIRSTVSVVGPGLQNRQWVPSGTTRRAIHRMGRVGWDGEPSTGSWPTRRPIETLRL